MLLFIFRCLSFISKEPMAFCLGTRHFCVHFHWLSSKCPNGFNFFAFAVSWHCILSECFHNFPLKHVCWWRDVYATRHFLPSVALAAVVVNWVGFGMTFFETNTIKYQLGLSEHRFSQSTLISMIFTQTIYPVNIFKVFSKKTIVITRRITFSVSLQPAVGLTCF